MPNPMRDAQLDIQSTLSRRGFLQYSLATLAGLAIGSSPLRMRTAHGASSLTPPSNVRVEKHVPPLFCLAYVDPTITAQTDQEAIIARYPLAMVPQATHPAQMRWRDRIKELNPKILMLGYQIVIEETSVPGPGHDRLRQVKDSWCVYPGGFYPTTRVESSNRRLRLFDPRKSEWQEGFLDACRTTLQSYPYDGLFLDQCSVFEKAHPIPAVKADMRHALQVTLLRLRQEFPDTLLIGNSSFNWQGLNGELNEGRPQDMTAELATFNGHAQPSMDLYHSLLKNPADSETVRKEMALAHSQGALYGASVNYQHVLWFDLFDEVIARYA